MKKLITIWFIFLVPLSGVYANPVKVIVPLKDKRVLTQFWYNIQAEMGKYEIKQNIAPHILEYGKAVYGKPTQGFPYCYALVYYCFYKACNKLNLDLSYIPIQRTGHSNTGFNWALKHGKTVKCELQPLDILIWKYSNSNSGHTATVKSVIDKLKMIVETFEGNTSANNKGSQDNGGVNTTKKRYLRNPIGRMFFRGAIGYDYK